MQKRKVQYKGNDGKYPWFWTTDAKDSWKVYTQYEEPDFEELFLLKNHEWVLETLRVRWDEEREYYDDHAVRVVARDEAFRWLLEHQQIGPGEKWPSELRDLAERNRAKRPRRPSRDVKGKIEQYLAKHDDELQEYQELIRDGEDEAVEEARRIFGRNAVARACGLCHSAVGQNQQWREVAESLRLVH
jgi:hypothetical protein